REDPAVAPEARRAGGEVEVIAPRGMAVPPARLDRDIAHDGARDRTTPLADQRSTDEAPAAVGPGDDRRPRRRPLPPDPPPAVLPRHVEDVLSLAQGDAAITRSPRQERVELAAPNDPAEVVDGHVDLALRQLRTTTLDARLRHRERDAEVGQQVERLRDDTT